MASNQTSNFGLSQWEPGDPVLREDFNADNQKIDGALAAKVDIFAGTYTGDGADSQLIPLGRTPKAVYVCRPSGLVFDASGADSLYGGLAVEGTPANVSGNPIVSIEEGGFRVHHHAYSTYTSKSNLANNIYHYMAFC